MNSHPPCYPNHKDVLTGLARECPECHIIDHYKVKGRQPVEVECKCGHRFIVQKYKCGERPRAINYREKTLREHRAFVESGQRVAVRAGKGIYKISPMGA